MKQTVSLLIPFKAHAKKITIKYDPSLHTAALKHQVPDFYPRLKETDYVNQKLLLRKSGVIISDPLFTKPDNDEIQLSLDQQAIIPQQQPRRQSVRFSMSKNTTHIISENDDKTKYPASSSRISRVNLIDDEPSSKLIEEHSRESSSNSSHSSQQSEEVTGSFPTESQQMARKSTAGNEVLYSEASAAAVVRKGIYQIDEAPSSRESSEYNSRRSSVKGGGTLAANRQRRASNHIVNTEEGSLISTQSYSQIHKHRQSVKYRGKLQEMEFIDEDYDGNDSDFAQKLKTSNERNTYKMSEEGGDEESDLSLSMTECQEEANHLLNGIVSDQTLLLKRLQNNQRELLSRSNSEASITENQQGLNIYKILGLPDPKQKPLLNETTNIPSSQHIEQQQPPIIVDQQQNNYQHLPSLISEESSVSEEEESSSTPTRGKSKQIMALDHSPHSAYAGGGGKQNFTFPKGNVQQMPETALTLIQRAFLEHQILMDKQLFEERAQQLSLVRQNLRLKSLSEAFKDKQAIELSKLQATMEKGQEKAQKYKRKLEESRKEAEGVRGELTRCKKKVQELKEALEESLVQGGGVEGEENEEEEDGMDQMKQALSDMNASNEFLQEQVALLTKESKSLQRQALAIPYLSQQVSNLSILLEDLQAENTRLLIENFALKRQINESPVKELTAAMERYRDVNARLVQENEDVRYKYEIAEKLRLQMKEHFQKYVNKALNFSSASFVGENEGEKENPNSQLISSLLNLNSTASNTKDDLDEQYQRPQQITFSSPDQVTDYTYELRQNDAPPLSSSSGEDVPVFSFKLI